MTHFPDWVEPMAATLTQERFTGPEWIFERKYDGIRALAFKHGPDVRLLSRNRLPQHNPSVLAAIARLAVDDAGAGFSSLRHILRLAPDFIKLDGALTRGIDTDQTRRALGAALISFASEIGVPIIAEGIETQEEVDALRALQVTCGQGFFLAEPAPLPAPEVMAAR